MGRFWTRAFVVGGSEGIGLAVARLLAHQGVDVAIFGRSEEKLRAAHESLRSESVRTYVGRLDVTDEAATRVALDMAVADFGVPDLVVSAAGFARAEWFHETSLD